MTEQTDRLNSALAGRYTIEREIGAGGMATVYLAHDVKHDRDVAIKVLHPDLGAALGGERFLAEIKTTAKLQHPHILPLLDSGDAGGLLCYVMPMVAGESLRERLTREKQLPVADAVRIASEVASALDYAHRHGVIHRDIKPENILLHDSQAIVADFGIALAVQSAGGSRMTQTGLSLGTPQYMSPEQAMGEKTIDARSDIYALGAVTYEMLTGEAPFTGASVQAIVAKVLVERPTPLHTVRDTVPGAVESAVLTALAKLPADRFANASAFSAALNARGEDVAPRSNARSETVGGTMPRATHLSVRELLAWGIATAAVIAFAVVYIKSRATPVPQVIRTTLDPVSGERLANTALGLGSTCGWIAVSPQGDRLAYTVGGPTGTRTVVRRIDELIPRAVTGGALGSLGFSPDGKWLAYSDGTQISKAPADGGVGVVLGNSPESVRGLSWTSSGVIVIGSAHGLRSIPAAGGEVKSMFGADSTSASTCPVMMPDGKHLLFARGLLGSAFRLGVAELATGAVQLLDVRVATPLGIMFGHALYVDGSGVLMALPFDDAKLKATGEPVPIESGIMVRDFNDGNASLSMSGTLAFVQGAAESQLVLMSAARSEAALTGEAREYSSPRYSPDGRKVAVAVTTNGSSDIWVYDISAHTFTKLTTEGVNLRPEWSPDGTRILFRSDRGGKFGVWWQRSDGGAKAELLYEPAEPFNEAILSPDAKWLIYRTAPGGPHSADIIAVSLTPDHRLVPLVTGPAIENLPRVSPDGKWLAYQSNESGRVEIYLRPFMGPGARVQVSDHGGAEPIWAPNGRAIYYRTLEGVVSVALMPGANVSIGERHLIVAGEYMTDPTHADYDISRDGTQFLMLKRVGILKGVIVHNWAIELREKLRALKK